jgi:hypothetical protein
VFACVPFLRSPRINPGVFVPSVLRVAVGMVEALVGFDALDSDAHVTYAVVDRTLDGVVWVSVTATRV